MTIGPFYAEGFSFARGFCDTSIHGAACTPADDDM
ncbi:hypothetical protein L901_09800 [Agrobacterium sp. D14]|nr:hypothetical protein L901_09800 [Agrobacterium sp. D14]